MTTKDMIEVIKAKENGKQIEVQIDGMWIPFNDTYNFNFESYEYRIKPEPKLRPWAYEEACKQISKIVRSKDNYGETIKIIHSIHRGDRVIQINELDVHQFMNKYRFLDGSPCGVVEVEE